MSLSLIKGELFQVSHSDTRLPHTTCHTSHRMDVMNPQTTGQQMQIVTLETPPEDPVPWML